MWSLAAIAVAQILGHVPNFVERSEHEAVQYFSTKGAAKSFDVGAGWDTGWIWIRVTLCCCSYRLSAVLMDFFGPLPGRSRLWVSTFRDSMPG